MPNGYGPTMRIFTKITKVPFSYLRNRGFISEEFVENSYLEGKKLMNHVLKMLRTP